MSCCGTSVLFVLKPPYTPQAREQFFTWLCEHTSMEAEACRQVALTGELTTDPAVRLANIQSTR